MISNNSALTNNSVLKEIGVFNTAYTSGIQSFTINGLIPMKIAYIYVKSPHSNYGAPVSSLSITGNICANNIQANLLNTDKHKNFSNGYGLVPFIPSSTSVTIKINCMRENTFAVLQ